MTGAENGATRTLRWTAGPVAFELESAEAPVLERARFVFGPWLNGSSASTPPRARFVVEAHGSPEPGRWRVQREGHEAVVVDSLDRALANIEYGAVASLHEPGSGVVALHAALLSRNGVGLLIVGPKEAGKSTLACALWAAGWRLHSDDNALVDPGARARAAPRRVSLRTPSRGHLEPDVWKRILALPGTIRTEAAVLFHPKAWTNGSVSDSVEVSAILFLARRGATVRPAMLEPLDGGRALLALVPYSNRRSAGFGRALEDLQPLADRARAFDLGRGDLTRMVARAEEAVRR